MWQGPLFVCSVAQEHIKQGQALLIQCSALYAVLALINLVWASLLQTLACYAFLEPLGLAQESHLPAPALFVGLEHIRLDLVHLFAVFVIPALTRQVLESLNPFSASCVNLVHMRLGME